MTVDFAKEYLLDDCADCPENKNGECMTESHCFEVKRMAIQALEQTRWIPVSERLPEDSGKYLVSAIDGLYEIGDYKAICIGWFAHKKDYDIKESEWRELGIGEKVVAWMPLPQPYNGESEDCN